MKWKDRFLSSSIPLEYEVAKILAKNNFSIDFDYSYKRLDASLEKEFSIDIKAGGFYPFPIKSAIKMQIDLLVECKYRNPNVTWLFIEDLNIGEYTNFSTKGVIKLVDEFSEYSFSNKAFSYPTCNTCLKGMEVNSQSGDVHDKGIIHGVNQLVYCIPTLLYEHLFGTLCENLPDNYPYIICPILVTTANLRILNHDLSIETVSQSKDLEDISIGVPFLKLYSNVYPSFQEHCRNTFRNLLLFDKEKKFEYFKELRRIDLERIERDNFRKMYSNPEHLLISLEKGIGNDIFRETLVCNFNHFPVLLSEIKKGITMIGKSMRKIKQ
jgi:hypothetical protein